MSQTPKPAFAALGLGLAVVLGWLSLRAAGPPAAAGPDAPLEEFSAARADEHLRALTRRPRPQASAEHAAARRYLVERLRGLGLETHVREATVLDGRGGFTVGSRAYNVVARLRGDGDGDGDGDSGSEAILLAAHYDTRPLTYGAGDDASGVAAILETLRALKAGPPLRRDVIVLITDGEERALFGAHAFVDEDPWMDEVGLVFNFESRGNRGPVIMFETAAGNHALVEEFARAVPHPFASSLTYEVYRRMPNDTDFSVFKRGGLKGLNFALIGHHPAYHTLLDSYEELDRGSLQHHGSYALALSRHFGDAASLPEPGADGVYFNTAGHWLVSYSSGTARVLSLVLVVLAAAAVTVRSRRHGGKIGGLGLGLAFFAGALISGFAVGGILWRVVSGLWPDLLRAPHDLPYPTSAFGVAGGLVVAALVVLIVRLMSRRAAPTDLWAGVLLAWTLLALLSAFFIAGVSYIFMWPAALGWLALLAREYLGERAWADLLPALAGTAGVILLMPLIRLFLGALTLEQAGPSLGVWAIMLTLLTLPISGVPGVGGHGGGGGARWSRLWPEAVLVALGLAVLVLTVWTAGPGDTTPRVDHLLWAADADRGTSYWISADRSPDEWTETFLGAGAAPKAPPNAFGFLSRDVLHAEAPWIEFQPPDLTASEEEGGEVRMRLASPRGAEVLSLYLESEASFRLLSIDGKPAPEDTRASASEGDTEFRLTFIAAPPEGIDVTIQPGDRPVTVKLADQSYGLPQIPGGSPERPSGWMPSSRWSSDTTFVSRSFVLGSVLEDSAEPEEEVVVADAG